MWKYSLTVDQAILTIKEKRKCIDINIGFIVQLGKWEELLKFGKELKIFKFDFNGNLMLIDLAETDKNEILNNTFSLLFVVKDNKLFKLVNTDQPQQDTTKVEKFVKILQTYDNYPTHQESIYLNCNLNNDFTFCLDNISNMHRY